MNDNAFKIMTGLSSLGLTIIPTTASAQSHMRPTSEAHLSITVPFGVDRPTHKNKSRLELGVRNYAPSSLFSTHAVPYSARMNGTLNQLISLHI